MGGFWFVGDFDGGGWDGIGWDVLVFLLLAGAADMPLSERHDSVLLLLGLWVPQPGTCDASDRG